MKRFALLIVGLLFAATCIAGPLQFSDASIQTNGASLTTQTPDGSGFVYGWIDAVIVDITSGSSDTNTITLSTLGTKSGTGGSRTLLTLSNIAADGTYPVRDLVTTQAGVDIASTPARIAMEQDKFRLTATSNGDDTNATAVVMDVYVIMSNQP